MKIARILPALLISISFTLSAQTIDYNKVILPKDASNISIEERLVQLAWANNPIHRVLEFEIESAQFKKKKSALAWFENIGITGNLNEFNIKSFAEGGSLSQEGNQFFPRYNVYARLPFSLFSENPLNKKIAVRELQIAKENQNLAKLDIRARVLTAYQEYIRTQELWKIASWFEETEHTNFVVMEQKFKNGEVLLEDYTASKHDYFTARMQSVNAESTFNKAKIALEQIIGVPLDEVLQN